jgi:hypothetical protein
MAYCKFPSVLFGRKKMEKRQKEQFLVLKKVIFSQLEVTCLRKRILNTDQNPDPATQFNADPDPEPC